MIPEPPPEPSQHIQQSAVLTEEALAFFFVCNGITYYVTTKPVSTAPATFSIELIQ